MAVDGDRVLSLDGSNAAKRSHPVTKEHQWRVYGFIAALTVFAGIGGFLFGYDTGVISGAILFIQDDFGLSAFWQEVVVSSAIAGAILGSLASGWLNFAMGRRHTILWASCMFTLGAVVMAFAPGVYMLIVGRVIVGIAVGVASMTVPIYIAEAAPEDLRGALVSIDVLLITAGQFVAYGVDAALVNAPYNWRWMLGLSAVPAVIQGIGMMFLPESPRLLVANGCSDDALAVLKRTRMSAEEAEQELMAIESQVDEERERAGAGGYHTLVHMLVTPALRRAVFVGVGLQFFQQVCGINTVMYYSPTILQKAGFGSNSNAIYASMAVAFTNMLMSVVAVVSIDRLGRRPLLIGSLCGVALALALLGVAFWMSGGLSHWTALAALVFYLVFFAPGMGPVPWAINAEIYPMYVRSMGTSMATCMNWSANLVVSLTFLDLLDFLGETWTFFMYAGVALVALSFVLLFVPETRGRSLEDIQQLFVGSWIVLGKKLPQPVEHAEGEYVT